MNRPEGADRPEAPRTERSVRYRFDDFLLDGQRMQLSRAGRPVPLARQAYELLVYLIEHRERMVGRRELLQQVWSDREVSGNAVAQAVTQIRRALESGPGAPRVIQTVYGKGFRFVADVEQVSAAAVPTTAHAPDPPDPELRPLGSRFAPLLSDLLGQLRPLQLFASPREAAEPLEVSLLSMYTALEITLEVRLRGPRGRGAEPTAGGLPELSDRLSVALRADLESEAPRLASPEPSRRRYQRRARCVEAAAVCPRLVITGPPGSGKSTVVRHLALCLAGALLANRDAHIGCLRPSGLRGTDWMPWERQPIVPIYVEIASFAASDAFAPSTDGGAHQLFAHLRLRDSSGGAQTEALEQYLAERDGEGALLILDGFDEAPLRTSASGTRDSAATREGIKEVIRSFVNRFPKARMIVTSRPYAYEPGSPWRLDAQGFEEVALAPLRAEQVREFCHHWYASLAERGESESAAYRIRARAEALAAELTDRPDLHPLTERPLTLTMLADLHAQHGALPTSRAVLFEESTALLLDRWNAARSSKRPGENRLTAELRMGLDELRRAVEHLAYLAQRSSAGGPGAALLRAGDVIELLFEHGARGESERVLDFLAERSGILVAESRYRYRFPHRSYQEYLAACYLAYRDFPGLLVSELREDPERWREVVPLVMGRLRGAPQLVVGLIDTLLHDDSPTALPLGGAPDRPLLAMLCAAGLEDAGLRPTVQEQSPHCFARLHSVLLETVLQAALPSERDRVLAAELLGQLGDPRVAELERVPLPGGHIWIGAQRSDPLAPGYDPEAPDEEGPVLPAEVRPFALSRYLVTVSQYARFMTDDGYGRSEYWHARGWQWRDAQGVKEPAAWPEQARHPNRPVVGVSWYEADAFARWAGGRLASEAEYEFAARGGAGWRYPWGNEAPTEQHAAFAERIPHPVPVGIYASAAQNPWALHDLTGNVGQWCRPEGPLRNPLGPDADGQSFLAPQRGGYYCGVRCERATRRPALGPLSREQSPIGIRVSWSTTDPSARES